MEVLYKQYIRTTLLAQIKGSPISTVCFNRIHQQVLRKKPKDKINFPKIPSQVLKVSVDLSSINLSNLLF